jgi:hypothetical protein
MRRVADHEQFILEIANQYNITPEELVGRSRKINIAEARQELMHKCHEHGMSIAEISRLLGRDNSTVAYGIKVHENKDTNPEALCRTDTLRYKTIKLFKEGYTTQEIAKKLGRSRDGVTRTIYNARQRGLIPKFVPKRSPTTPDTPTRQLTNYLKKFYLKSGTMAELLITHMTPEVRDFWVKKTMDNKYETVAECVADYMTDVYFEETNDEQS